MCSLFLITTHISKAQNKHLQAYTLEDGLPQSQIYALEQDAKGYLWLGTQGGGLVRFDGNEFKVYNEHGVLPSNYITALLSTNDRLVIGTKRGLSIKLNQEFINYETPEITNFRKINDDIFILTTSGIYSLSATLELEKLRLHPEIDAHQVNDLLYFKNYFWLATENGLWKLSELDSNSTEKEQVEQNDFKALSSYKHKIFASTFNDGTVVFKPSNFSQQLLIREPLRINSTTMLTNNQLWITTDDNGILVIDAETNQELFAINNRNGLSVSHVRQVIQDRENNIWIATSGGGLYKYFQNNFKHFNTQTGLKGNRVYAVHHDNGAVWISTSEEGLMRLDDFGIHDVALPKSFSEVKIKTISSDKNHNIWAGSEGKGLLFHGKIELDSVAFDTLKQVQQRIPKTIRIDKVFNTESGFPYDWIRSIHVDNEIIYAATYTNGIVKFSYQPTTDSLKIFKTFGKLDGIQDPYIRQMTKDDNGRLWYATQNGHLGYLQNDRITDLGPVLGLNIPINCVLYHNKVLFLGTAENGIWCSNDDNYNSFRKLKGVKTTTSENIYQLIFDDDNYLWVGTEKGVDKLELDNDLQVNDAFFFGKNDGFLGIETCLNAVDKDDSGNLWFGALYGLTKYQPLEKNKAEKKPTLFLEDVKIAYKSIDTINLSLWVNSKRRFNLNSDQRQVSFTYKTIDIDHPNDISYRYKLNEDSWSPWTTNETQDFSELSFGAHTFTVQSRNYRWIESDPISFSFFIDTPIHKKTWFLALVIGIIALVCIGMVYQYVKRLKQRNKRDKERLELENHLLTLEQKALRLQMNPHFIFNVLNGIKAMAPKQPEKMNQTVNNFATLLRETLNNSRKDSISLEQEVKTLKHYIEVERLMAEMSFNYDIILKTDLDIDEILIPPMLVQPFVENAIRHGILKGNKQGELKIIFETLNDRLKVTISDNGIGIFKSQKQDKKTDHQSMALKVTRERLESIAGKDTLSISELKNKDGSIAGTKIIFHIPLATDY